MSRGRRARPPEIKALIGNPGKRKLALRNAEIGRAAPAKSSRVVPPDYLKPGEVEIFKMAVSSLPANILRRSDTHAIARWAVWLRVWVAAKQSLDGKAHWYESESRHGKFLREHPISKRMHAAEQHLITLEDRLGLNVVSRNNIVHRLFQMPAAHPGGMFGDEKPDDGSPLPVPDDAPEVPASPLGFPA